MSKALRGPAPNRLLFRGLNWHSKSVTQSSLGDFDKALAVAGLQSSFIAAKTFVPALKSRVGSSHTLVSGGFAHH